MDHSLGMIAHASVFLAALLLAELAGSSREALLWAAVGFVVGCLIAVVVYGRGE